MLYPVHMMPIIYTREFLKNLPQLRKEEKLRSDIDRAYSEMSHAVEYAATNGQTQYLYMIPHYDPRHLAPYEIPSYTDEQLVNGFREKFPGCDVLYQEFWVEEPATAPLNTSVRKQSQIATSSSGNEMRLKKAILIDWS